MSAQVGRDEAHQRGLILFVYFVDAALDNKEMQGLGVDGICPYDPDKVMRALAHEN